MIAIYSISAIHATEAGETMPKTGSAFFCLFFLGYTVEAHMRANTQNVQEEQETRGVEEARKKQYGTET